MMKEGKEKKEKTMQGEKKGDKSKGKSWWKFWGSDEAETAE